MRCWHFHWSGPECLWAEILRVPRALRLLNERRLAMIRVANELTYVGPVYLGWRRWHGQHDEEPGP